jgi:hypothetical protein
MKVSEAFKGNYMTVSDLGGEKQNYTVANVSIEAVGQEKEEKPVIRFKELGQGFVLNKTNAETISEVLGEETDAWIGEQITLKPDKTTYAGKRVNCIRVAVPSQAATKEPVEEPIEWHEEDSEAVSM